LSSNWKLDAEVNILQSNFHTRLHRFICPCPIAPPFLHSQPQNPTRDDFTSYSEAGDFDRVVIQELLKKIAQTQQIDLNAKQRFKGTSHSSRFDWSYSFTSGNHKQSQFPLTRRASRPPTHYGEVHVRRTYHPLRE
jgi:hypothetical protein